MFGMFIRGCRERTEMKTLKRTEVEDRCVLVTNTLDRNQRGGGNKAKERDLTEDKE